MVITLASPRGNPAYFSSSFASSSSSMGEVEGFANVRVVTRIRPLLTHEKHRRSCLTSLESQMQSKEPSVCTPMKDPSSSTSLAETPLIENKTARQNLEACTSPQSLSFSSTNYGNATRLMAARGEMRREFVYDAVLSPEASQREVYDRSVGEAIRRNIFRGYNTTIIAYGQSGSGKTYTMSGQKEADKMALSPEGSSFKQSFNFEKSALKDYSVDDDDGIIPRAIHDLFKSKQRYKSAKEVTVSLTYMEVYNDELRDLLVDGGSDMRIRDAGEGGFFVEGLCSVVVKSAKHARDVIDTATTRRRTASTKLNLRSSRSHAICTLTVSINSAGSRPTVGGQGTEIVTAKLTMVDLAGSERIKQSGVTGTAQKESININKDLFVLAKVVSALADKSNLKTTAHVPYRDSKLTSLLRDSLGDVCFEESINTLRYAERTKAITNSIKPNVIQAELSLVECSRLRTENTMLKAHLKGLQKRIEALAPDRTSRTVLQATTSIDKTQAFVDDVYLTFSGDTVASSKSSSCETWMKDEHGLIDSLNFKSSESEQELRSMGSLMDQITTDETMHATKANDMFLSDQRIRKALKAENDNLRKENKKLMDSILARETKAKYLEQVVLNRQNDVKEAEARCNALRYDMCRMEERLQHLRSFIPDLSQSQAVQGQGIELSTISTLRNANTLPLEVEHLKDKLNDANAETCDIKARLAAANARIIEMEKKESLCHQQTTKLQASLDILQEYRLHSEQNLELLKNESKMLSKERDEARIQTGIQQMDNENLKVSLHTKDSLIAELREELRKTQAAAVSQHERDFGSSEAMVLKKSMDDSFLDSGSLDSSMFADKRNESTTSHDHTATHQDIRVHAAKMLFFANQAIEKGRSNRSTVSSIASSNGSEFKPDGQYLAALKSNKVPRAVTTPGKPPLASRPETDSTENQVVISNIEKVENSNFCTCYDSLFSGNAEHVEFYLPKLGMACACGHYKEDPGSEIGKDPMVLSNMLRPWQVEFLSTLNLRTGVDLVHAYNQRGDELAKEMRKWRKDKKLPSVKTKSCHVALHIWSRTCKAVVRSVRKQRAQGATVFKRPEFLELPTDGRTISTLGYGSILDMKSDMIEI